LVDETVREISAVKTARVLADKAWGGSGCRVDK